jgi:hypothetical protein
MKKRNYRLTRRRTVKKKDSPAEYNNDIKFMCEKCGYELFFWFDGVEHEVSGVRCDKCNEVYPLSDFFIENEEEIKKELWKMYGNDPELAPFDIQMEFMERYTEAGIARDKPVYEENMVVRGEKKILN